VTEWGGSEYRNKPRNFHSLFLYSDPPPPPHSVTPVLMAQTISKPTFSPIIPQHCPQPSSFYTHLHAYEDGTDRVFRNIGIYISDAGESPKRKHTTLYGLNISLLWPSIRHSAYFVSNIGDMYFLKIPAFSHTGP